MKGEGFAQDGLTKITVFALLLTQEALQCSLTPPFFHPPDPPPLEPTLFWGSVTYPDVDFDADRRVGRKADEFRGAVRGRRAARNGPLQPHAILCVFADPGLVAAKAKVAELPCPRLVQDEVLGTNVAMCLEA